MNPTLLRFRCLAAVAASTACAVVGCVTPVSPDGGDSTAAESNLCAGSDCADPDDIGSNTNKPILTGNNNVQMLRGYHELLDTVTQTCVEAGKAVASRLPVQANPEARSGR
jgi:hypothetical protein